MNKSSEMRKGATTRKKSPGTQPSVTGTELGGTFTKVAHTQVTPPSNLGYVAPPDEQFARTNGDNGPNLGWQRTGYEPLWNQSSFVLADRKLQHDTRFMTPHSRLEELQLYVPAFTQASRASDNTHPKEHLRSATGIWQNNQGALRRR